MGLNFGARSISHEAHMTLKLIIQTLVTLPAMALSTYLRFTKGDIYWQFGMSNAFEFFVRKVGSILMDSLEWEAIVTWLKDGTRNVLIYLGVSDNILVILATFISSLTLVNDKHNNN